VARGVMIVLAGPNPVSFPPLFSGMPFRIAGGAMPQQGLAAGQFSGSFRPPWGYFCRRADPAKSCSRPAEDAYAAELVGVNVEAGPAYGFAISGY